MKLWQTLLVAVGGNAVLLALLAFLGRSLIGAYLARAAEQFKAGLQRAAVEHEVRFSRLHQKRAEVLAELYRLLAVAVWKVEAFLSPLELAGGPDKQQLVEQAWNAIAAYHRCFDENRIYFSAKLCGSLESFASELRGPVMLVWSYRQIEAPTGETRERMLDVWNAQWLRVKNEVPKLRAGIEAEFRQILEAGGPSGGPAAGGG